MGLFGGDFIDIHLKYSKSINKAKRPNLIFEMAILGFKDCFLLIILINLYLMIDII